MDQERWFQIWEKVGSNVRVTWTVKWINVSILETPHLFWNGGSICLFFLLLIYLQVEELHRLHTVQKALMENLAWREFHTYNSRTAITQSTLLSCANQTSVDALAKETIFPSILMVNGSHQLSECYVEWLKWGRDFFFFF